MMSNTCWSEVLLATGSLAARWDAVFDFMQRLVADTQEDSEFERSLDTGDRLLADARPASRRPQDDR